MSQVLGVAWYRSRATLGRRWGGYLTLVLLIGLVGGLSMAAVAGARRTQSSFPIYLASTSPSDLNFLSGFYKSGAVDNSGYDSGYDPNLIRTVAHLPHVKRVESYAAIDIAALAKNGAPESTGTALIEGSVDGEFFNQDRLAIIAGRMANPKKADEAVLSQEFAQGLHNGLPPGSVVPVGVYSNAQLNSPFYGTTKVKPLSRLDMRVVGIGKYNDTVVQDDVDANPFGRILFTPALTRTLLACCVYDTATYLQLDHGSQDVPAVEAEIQRVLPKGASPLFFATGTIESKTQQAIEPESIALGVFGGIAALATLLIAGQVVSRQLRRGADEERTLRSLGAGPATTLSDALFGIVCAVVIGSLLAGLVAAVLSPLAPIGPVRPFDPAPGIALDWTVLITGVLSLAVFLIILAVALGILRSPHRQARSRQLSMTRGSHLGRMAETSGLPAPAVVGIRFGLEARDEPGVVLGRSAMLGAVIAVTILISTLTFSASLNSLVSHPALYGWNWNYELASSGFGYSDIPQHQIDRLLARDRSVQDWTGVYFAELQIDGHTEPVIGGTASAPVGPPILSGHGFDTPHQVVLGPATLAELHKRVGDSVMVSDGVSAPTRLRIVGTATMPTAGQAGSLHPTMGSGAWLSSTLIPASVRNPFHSPLAGPQAIFVRLQSSANPTAAMRSLDQITHNPGVSADGTVSILPVQRPAQIVDYRSAGTTPSILAGALVAGVVIALGLTLIAAVHRRRRTLALLRVLGFTQRQLAATVAWQSSVTVAIGVVVGVPLGILLGRYLWILFAHEINVVPAASVPVLSIALVAAGAILLANLVAALPGQTAARTSTALVLRSQ